MTYRIEQLKTSIYSEKLPETLLMEKIKKAIKGKSNKLNLKDIKVVKQSIDARDKKNIQYVYSIDFKGNLPNNIINKLKIKKIEEKSYKIPFFDIKKMKNFKRPVIVGFGPCGMFASLVLAEAGLCPIVVERGSAIEKRVKDVKNFWENGQLDTESNVQFGEGGAGTFSDGKLTTQINDPRIKTIMEKLFEAGGNKEILYKQKAHIGTDLLRKVVINIRKKIIALGGEIHFDTKLIDFDIINDKVTKIKLLKNKEEEFYIDTDNLILALGHSARDTFNLLNNKNISMEQKPLSIGVRVEHHQSLIDDARYGGTIDKLGAGDYKLSYRCKSGRGVYTFCMCPGGEVISASSEIGHLVTNGMSYNARSSGKANSALLVDVRKEDFGSDHVLAGVEFQKKYEKIAFELSELDYKPIKCTLKDFKENIENGIKVRQALPDFAVESILEGIENLGKKLKGFDGDDTVIYGIETRSSSPLRILRNKNYESSAKGIYPAGEGAGYAGGIVSSAVDGMKVAEEIIRKIEIDILEEKN